MTPDVLAKASDDAILMHPLPRKHEMGTDADHAILDNDPRSVYFHQMQNGMYVRMALLAGVLGATTSGRAARRTEPVTTLRIPGAVDPHVHLRDLDWAHKATVERETAAALAGGYWAVLDMPNTPPNTVDRGAPACQVRVRGRPRPLRLRALPGRRPGRGRLRVRGRGGRARRASRCTATTPPARCCSRTTSRAGGTCAHGPGPPPRRSRSMPRARPSPRCWSWCAQSAIRVALLPRQQRPRRSSCSVQAKADGLPISVGVTPHHLYLDGGRPRAPGRLRHGQAAAQDHGRPRSPVGRRRRRHGRHHRERPRAAHARGEGVRAATLRPAGPGDDAAADGARRA